MRLINQHLFKFQFKCEDYNKALEYFPPGGFASDYSKSGCHHLDISPHHRQHLGFAWTFTMGNQQSRAMFTEQGKTKKKKKRKERKR